MSDVEVELTESLSRHEAARQLMALATALADGGKVEVALGKTTLKLHVPDHVRCEIELEVDGDEVELEFELKWSTVKTDATAHSDAAADGASKPAAARNKRAARSAKGSRQAGK